MVYRKRSSPFLSFLKSFTAGVADDSFGKIYSFWKHLPEDGLYGLSQCCLPAARKAEAVVKWKAINTFRILDLPLELREMVIAAALGLSNCTIIDPFESMFNHPPIRRNIALLRANKQIYQEAASILYTRSTFRFRQLCEDTCLNFCRISARVRLNTIRSLILECDHISMLALYGVKIRVNFRHLGRFGAPMCALIRDPKEKGPHGTVLEYFHGLQHLCISFPHPQRVITFISQRRFKGFVISWSHVVFPASGWLTDVSRWPCQRTFCIWIWAAARPRLTRIPKVEFKVGIILVCLQCSNTAEIVGGYGTQLI